MTTTTKDPSAAVRAEAEEIVGSGRDVRPRLAGAFTQAACQSQQAGEGLLSLVRAAVDGARQGLDRTVSKDRDDVLRQVLDALGDGLSQTALAGRLAIEEAASTSRQCTAADLARLRDDLTAVRELFAETVRKGLKTGKALTAGQVETALTHAGRVAERLGPVFTDVVDAARQHPVTLAREGFRAGVAAGEGAAGSLFQALGRMLQRAGEEMRRENRPGK